MEILIIIAIFLVLLGIFANFSIVFEFAKKKGYEEVGQAKWMSFIPYFGYKYIKGLPNLKPNVTKAEFDYLFSFEVILKKLLLVSLLLIGLTILFIPIALVSYVSFINNFTRTLVVIFVTILLLLVHQGLVVEYAKKKGYEGIEPGLVGLIPVYGFYYFKSKPKRRNTSLLSIKATFSPKNILLKMLINAELTLLVIVVLIPVIYIFGMAFAEGTSTIPNEIWPSNPSLGGFDYLFNSPDSKFGLWYMNTLIIAIINMLIGTVIITGASYVFARYSFKGKKAGLLTILVLQAFPSFMGLIAMYVLFWKFGLLGQPLYLTILYIGGAIPGNLWLIKGFLSQIPKDLDESAMIDGASKLQIFTYIILPLAVPILTFVAVSMFMAPWMDYMLPGYLLNVPAPGVPLDKVQEQWTLAVGIFSFINGQYDLNYPAFAAAALIVGMPIAIIYMIFQRYLIEGIMAGATKG
ncbi:Maltose transport system permease protein malG [Acholeplasma oculi]|uniref:Putative Glycerol-3-phosphate/Glycerol-2-phosphate ABC transporter, permease protein UgpE n=1 Tax=Acholeplasma oculi TaxID=35623 RepID=A0A061ABL8_9MOLU|nr:sugar ABC transporter permease [Acholeplasma oculi]CDR30804.1 putative Glycerol-3-phosphate/Glycerol-2-phosphate ABC transporter, permease protein UgpE [Acholeplasma oculi]SKC35045.1 arabinogalactan oligomer / maltooligosaccharide transport system permease protein [Acholeplasma oculi]SUT89784.1 Maltose transport system permease protein malG [Acholeplasma oculi]